MPRKTNTDKDKRGNRRSTEQPHAAPEAEN
jgi:hypothetical protein